MKGADMGMKMCAALVRSVLLPGTAVFAQEGEDARSIIRNRIDGYCEAVNMAGEGGTAEKVWLADERASMIFPRGKASGWQDIAETFFRKIMGGAFSDRRLTLLSEPSIQVFDGFAVAEFDWQFEAVRRSDGLPVTTRGRESQVFMKSGENDWRIVHVHYSQLPQN